MLSTCETDIKNYLKTLDNRSAKLSEIWNHLRHEYSEVEISASIEKSGTIAWDGDLTNGETPCRVPSWLTDKSTNPT